MGDGRPFWERLDLLLLGMSIINGLDLARCMYTEYICNCKVL